MKNYTIWLGNNMLSEHESLADMLSKFSEMSKEYKDYCKMYDDARRMYISGYDYLHGGIWTKENYGKYHITCDCKIISFDEFVKITDPACKTEVDILVELSKHFERPVTSYMHIEEENNIYVLFGCPEKISDEINDNICCGLELYGEDHIDIAVNTKLFAQVMYHSKNNSFPVGKEVLIEDKSIVKYIADKYGIGYCEG